MDQSLVSKEPSRLSQGPKRSDASHQAILAAARELLDEGGAAAVTFEAIARRAKAGKPTIYRWWPNKSALLLELCEQHKEQNLVIADQGSLRLELYDLIHQLWIFWQTTPCGAALAAVIAEAQISPELRAHLFAHFADDSRGPMTPILLRAIERGEIPRERSLSALREVILAMNWFRLLTGRLYEADIPELVDTMIDGLRARA